MMIPGLQSEVKTPVYRRDHRTFTRDTSLLGLTSFSPSMLCNARHVDRGAFFRLTWMPQL